MFMFGGMQPKLKNEQSKLEVFAKDIYKHACLSVCMLHENVFSVW